MSPRDGPRVTFALAGLHLLLCASAFADDRFLHDEGLLTHVFAELVARDPWPAIFLQKVRPPIAILYAPLSALGLSAFLWAHACVGAAGVVAIAAAARRLGHGRPNAVAAVVAVSPMVVAGSASGVSNLDAVAGLCVATWAMASGRWTLGGGVCGALVWVRSELAVVVLAFAGVAAIQRHPRFFLGLVVWPVAYGLGGAVYHHDVWWMLHWPPALPEPMPNNPFWDGRSPAATSAELAAAFVALTPLAGLALTVRWRDLSAIERGLAVGTVVLVLALVLMPRWQIFNFDHSARYLMPAVVAVALAIGRVADEGFAAPGRHTTLALAAAAGLVVGGLRLDGHPGPALALATVAIVVAVGRAGRPRVAGLLAGGLLALGPVAFGSGARIARATEIPHLEPMLARLSEHADELATRPVYTNEPTLAAFLARSGGLPQATVYYLVQADQLHELTRLTNPANGQRAAIHAALQQGMYGIPVFPVALDPDAVPPGALFVLTRDARLRLVMPKRTWDGRLRVLHPGGPAEVLELVPASGGRR